MTKICVIFNPVARGDKARRLRRHLEAMASQAVWKPTWAAGTGRPLAAAAVREGYETIVAAGGDGTLNEVLNGIGDVPGGFDRARLGVLPLGTVNVFALEHRLSASVESAWQCILAGHERRLDLVRVESRDQGQPASRYFMQMAGAGWDARAVERVDWGLKKKMGWLAYLVSAAQTLREPQPIIQVQTEQGTESAALVLLGNGRFYGGTYRCFPAADPADGELDLTLFPTVNPRLVLRVLWPLLVRHRLPRSGVRYARSRAPRLSSDQPVPFQLDGELAGWLPVDITVRPRLLRLIGPVR